jgi:predicted hydrocarbon binding protein
MRDQCMDEEKKVTDISIRAAHDALSEIIGKHARNLVLKKAGLERIIDAPPPYDFTASFTIPEQAHLYHAVVDYFGKLGAQGILRQIGYKAAALASSKGIADHLRDVPEPEQLYKLIDLFHYLVGKGRVEEVETGVFALNVLDCIHCSGVKSKKQFCSHYAGALQALVDSLKGKRLYSVVEEECFATGGNTCLFVLRKIS